MSAYITPTDEDLAEFMALQGAVKKMILRMEEIKKMCKLRGSFCSTSYVCTVITQSRRGLVGLEKVIDALGVDLLEEKRLISYTTYDVVKVSTITHLVKST